MGMVRGVHGGLRRVRRIRFLGCVERRHGAGHAGLPDVVFRVLVPRLSARLAGERKVRPGRGDKLDRQSLHLDRVPVCVRRLHVRARNGVFPPRKGTSPRRGLRCGAFACVLGLLVYALLRRTPRMVPVDDLRRVRVRARRPRARKGEGSPLAAPRRVPRVGIDVPARPVAALQRVLGSVFLVPACCRFAWHDSRQPTDDGHKVGEGRGAGPRRASRDRRRELQERVRQRPRRTRPADRRQPGRRRGGREGRRGEALDIHDQLVDAARGDEGILEGRRRGRHELPDDAC